MRICVFGLGYVGSVSAACLAHLGHYVAGVDVAEGKVELVNQGVPPVQEQGLAEITRAMVKAGRLRATHDSVEAVLESDAAFICVGTPSTPSGGVNTDSLERVSIQIGEAIRNHRAQHFVVFNRSTCLPSVHDRIQDILSARANRDRKEGYGYVCHPEFLREGSALADFFEPAKMVFGVSSEASLVRCKELYPGIEAQTFFTSVKVASMVKYADNCFHALKVTFANEIGMICKEMKVNSSEVMDIFCTDAKLNISTRYLKPGMAFGGSCLPKDLRGILDASRELAMPLPMLKGVMDSNRIQIERLANRIRNVGRSRVGVVGLSFKEGTDDTRESPLVTVVEYLLGKGYPVKIYDRHFCFDKLLGANRRYALSAIPHLEELLVDDLKSVIEWADIVVVGHRLAPDIWKSALWRGDQLVIDLVRIEELRQAPGYEGLYW